jgi:enoyl-CoA hydratase
MSDPILIAESLGPVRLLKINRPKALNAINIELISELHDELQAVETSQTLRAVVITGAGERAFAAGADITELTSLSPADAVQYSRHGQAMMQSMAALSVPVIAAVNGFALGGGLELALACDFIYAAQSATFGLVESNLGLLPGYGGVGRLSRRIGESAAKEALMTAKRYSADEALRMGLVNRVLPDAELLDTTIEVAQTIAKKSAGSMRLLKSLFESIRDTDQRATAALEQSAFGLIFADADAQEGIQAFLEKRPPNFRPHK